MRYVRTVSSHTGSLRSSLMLAGLVSFLTFGACSSGSSTMSSGPPNVGDLPGLGTVDRPENASASVNEPGMSATIAGGKLLVLIPITSKLTSPTAGTLRVSLRSVDGKQQTASQEVSYSLAAKEARSLTAELALPPSILKQSDLVGANVIVEDGAPLGLHLTRSLLHLVARYELRLDGPSMLTSGRAAAWRVRAQEPVTKQPLAGQAVTLKLRKDGNVVEDRSATTGQTGDAIFNVTAGEAGDYVIDAGVTAQGTSAAVSGSVAVGSTEPKVLLTTDKPIYQPGQMIHMRALALAPRTNTPIANADVVFELLDGKGNKIMKRPGKTDAYGIASTDFRLGSSLNQGTFKVNVIAGEASSAKTVEVKPYALPKFKAEVTTDKTWYLPGQTLTGAINAGYFFGKPVATGDVQIVATTLDVGETVFQTVTGKTDANGRFEFQIHLPSALVGLPIDHGNALVNLKVHVQDTAGQQVDKSQLVTVAQNAVDISLVPEATNVVPGIENHFDLFVTDPTGGPTAQAAAELTLGGSQVLYGTTDNFGWASFTWTPPSTTGDSVPVTAKVTPSGAAPVSESFTFGIQQGSEHVVVRTDKAVYQTGDTVQVQVVSSAKTPRIYVDWLNDGQAVDMRTLEAQGGEASFTMNLDTSLIGANRIEAYVVDPDGNIVRAGRTVFARNGGALNVQMTPDKALYVPGEQAHLTFSVSDDQGNPSVAALGVQIVDQAVFALVDAQPGLLRTYFELEDEFAKPQYEIEGPRTDLASTLYDGTASSDPAAAAAAQERAAATFAALGDASPVGLSLGTWETVLAEAGTLLAPYYSVRRGEMLTALQARAKAIREALAAEGCTPQMYSCDNGATNYSQRFMQALGEQTAVFDFWGNRYRNASDSWGYQLILSTDGPDEKQGTLDDLTETFSIWEIDPESMDPSHGSGGQTGSMDGGAWGGGAAGGAAGAGGSATGGSAGSAGQAGNEPRVRKDFPETLYVNPALITGSDGKASIDVGMADSITEWRISTLANSPAGKLGSSVHGVTVFQDFFVDVDFPSALTLGDEVQFPVAVYNYLTTPQTVSLELQPEDWYSPLGGTSMALDLQPGQVTGVRFPVRVDKVGFRTLTVRAYGSSMSDAVARSVRVIPNGKQFTSTQSGTLEAGELTQTVSFPSNAVEGSPQLKLEVFPAFLSQVVQGMDSLLQVPSGCFEQTTSTTWPNVLVSRYMIATNQLTPAIQMKADSYISAGYQRLLTFEHPTGGFSWFGTQDASPNVSVTAFGVMEFADMAKVATVDDAMLTRTVNWLASKQEPDGSWTGEQTEFFSFNTSTTRNTAFVTWALQTAGYQGSGLSTGLGYIKTHLAGEPPDLYTLALAANAAVAIEPNGAFTSDLLTKLDAAKIQDGTKVHWSAEDTQTNFYGSGADADVATTALAAYAMLASSSHGETAAGALDYLAGTKDSMGNFGSTQATIWTLRTMILAATKGTAGAEGTLTVEMDGTPFATINLTKAQSDVMSTVELGSFAVTGNHEVKMGFVGTGKPSYGLISSYYLPWTDVTEPPGPLTVTVDYDKTSLALEETVNATVHVVNNTTTTQRMVLVTVGIPPGFELLTEDLQDDLTAGTISTFELTGKQLTLYLTQVAASGAAQVQYRLRAKMPVTAEDGGATVYPYYEPAAKSTSPSTKLTVTSL